MQIETFLLERNQTLYENDVDFNLTESGVHPCTLREILTPNQLESLLDIPLGYGYTDGRPQLRHAISQWYPGSEIENVLVTTGTAEANLLSVLSLLSPGDELIFVLPNFMQITGLATSLGIRVTPIHLQAQNDWQLDLNELRALISPQTKMIAFSNPNNPTGRVFDMATMKGLAAITQEHKLYLLSDEIYRGAELSGSETPTFYGLCERVIVTSGMAKSLALAGLRIGWIVAPSEIIYTAMCRQDYTTIGTGILNQHIAEIILQPEMRQRILARSHGILRHNLEILKTWVEQHKRWFDFTPPQAGGMIFMRYRLAINSSELSRRLRAEASVFVVAGDWFGLDGYIRIGIGSEPDYLQQALMRMEPVLQQSDLTRANDGT